MARDHSVKMKLTKAAAIAALSNGQVNFLDSNYQFDAADVATLTNDGFYVDSLGWVYYRKGEYRQAIEQLERAVNLTSNDPTITEHLGDAYRKIGKLREAGNEYRDALKKAQETEQVARLKDKLQVLENAQNASGH